MSNHNSKRKDPMKALLTIFVWGTALCSLMCAQVSVMATPDPIITMAPVHLKAAGPWTVRACNDGATAVSVPEERVFMAIPSVQLVSLNEATIILQTQQAKSVPAKLAQYAGYGLGIAAVVTGWGAVQSSVKVVGSIAAGQAIAQYMQGQASTAIPAIGPYTSAY
jgi:hypothetical protein